MRRVLCLIGLLCLLAPASGCGAAADAPPPTITPELSKKKGEEKRKEMEEGIKKKDETYKRPGS